MTTTAYRPQKITAALIRRLSKLDPPDRLKEIRDRNTKLTLRHHPKTGRLVLYVELGRGKREKLCDARDLIDPSHPLTMAQIQARAVVMRGETTNGRDFAQERTASRGVPTLAAFLDETHEESYGWWVIHNRRDGKATLARLKACFLKSFGKRRLDGITPDLLDAWVTRRGRTVIAETINRDLNALRALLNKALKWKKITSNPIEGFESLEVDRRKRTQRALTDVEVKALRDALVEREERMRKARRSGNEWRAERGQEVKPGLDAEFVDALRPAVEISLETGLRRSELLALTWEVVNLRGRVIYIKGESTKSYLSRDVPLNAGAVTVLRKWQLQQGRPTKGYVFPGAAGHIQSLKKSFSRVLDDAGIERETAQGKVVWHSLRHTFGSTLGAAGVDPETLRELMGHADLSTTQRYLHTDKDRKRQAVELLS